jgi:ketosteroid isomerase-like protein
MSQANVEVAQRSVDALNRRDVATLAALSTRDFEWIAAMGAIEGDRSFRGREGNHSFLDHGEALRAAGLAK